MSNKRASPQSVPIKYQISEYIRDGEERNSHESFNILCLTHPQKNYTENCMHKVRSFIKNVEEPISQVVISISYAMPCSVSVIHFPSEEMLGMSFGEEKQGNNKAQTC